MTGHIDHRTDFARTAPRVAGRRAALAAAAAAAALALTACGGPAVGGEPSAEPSASAPAATIEPTPSMSAPSSAALDCEQLLPLVDIRAQLQVDSWTSFEFPAKPLSEHTYGPVATATAASATEIGTCSWAVPNSGTAMTIVVTTLPTAERDALTAALDASDYYRASVDAATAYTLDPSDIDGVSGYAFAGDHWLVLSGSVPADDASVLLLKAANSLG